MHAKAFLRIFAPLLLAAALVGSCGSDSHSADGDDDNDESSSSKKKDAGSKKEKDAGKKTATEEDEDEAQASDDDEEADDEEADDEGSEEEDPGTAMCTAHTDCPAGEDGAKGCCDIPTGTCFVSDRRACPVRVGSGTMRPSYN